MESVEKTRKDLLDLYKTWVEEVDNKLKGDGYSNPYYVSIPDNWFDSNNRIMIVGEEGFGEWGAGKQYGWHEDKDRWEFNDFDKIIDYNRIKWKMQIVI